MSTKTGWLAHAISRNVFPLAGVLLLGWDATNVLLLYFVDTVLAIAVIFAGLAGAFLPDGTAAGRRHFASGAGVIIPVVIVIVAVTLPFVLGRNFDWAAAIEDAELRAASCGRPSPHYGPAATLRARCARRRRRRCNSSGGSGSSSAAG